MTTTGMTKGTAMTTQSSTLTYGFFFVTLLAIFHVIGSFQPVVISKSVKNSKRPIVKLSAATADTDRREHVINGEKERNKEKIIDPDGLVLTVQNRTIFEKTAGRAANCLFKSDIRRGAIGTDGIPSEEVTTWIDGDSSFALRESLDQIKIKLADERTGRDRDDAAAWIRWLKSFPSPAIVDWSAEFRSAINQTLTNEALDYIEQSREDFLSRIACRLLVIPSGAELSSPMVEPTGSIIYGKLLYGGVTRYRILRDSSGNEEDRRAGERTDVKSTAKENVPSWMVFGGGDRMYEAVDMGSAAILEIILLPSEEQMTGTPDLGSNMVISGLNWEAKNVFDFVPSDDEDDSFSTAEPVESGEDLSSDPAALLSGTKRNDAFREKFQSSVGGLQPQIDAIVRRVLDGRVIRPADDDEPNKRVNGNATSGGEELPSAALEAKELEMLGLTPIRGLLLYGPPGCGKTALAREISKALRARAPKIVSAPELLDRWVGGSEKLVRSLFADAEAELASCDGDATKSALHVIVIDEIDAVFRKRTSAEDSGEATRSSVVNQILAKLDGVNAIPNVLLIGMTNRRELLDDALLRPGRLEAQVEVPLPDKEGRREILNIHFGALRRKGRLSKPLCCAIDGVPLHRKYEEEKKDSPWSSAGNRAGDGVGSSRKRHVIKRVIKKVIPSFVKPVYDLADDSVTDGFSGADIAGLVRCAGSIALARTRKQGNGVEDLLISLDDVKQALVEVKR